MHILIPWRKHMQRSINRYKNCKSCTHKMYPLPIYWGEKWLSSQCGKKDKKWSNNYIQTTCTSSYHEENICKGQLIGIKTVRVALTRCTHCLYIEVKNDSQCGKKDKKWSNNYIQTTCTFSYHEESICKGQINRYKTVRGVALTRGTHCLYIEVKND